MNVTPIRSKWGCDLLLSANHELEQLYIQQNNPCLALHISRNYHLLQAQDVNSKHQKLWQEKAKLWWKLYCSKRSIKRVQFFDNDLDYFIIFS